MGAIPYRDNFRYNRDQENDHDCLGQALRGEPSVDGCRPAIRCVRVIISLSPDVANSTWVGADVMDKIFTGTEREG